MRWDNRLTYLVPNYLTCWLLTCGVYYIYFRTNKLKLRRIVLIHVGGMMAFGLVHAFGSVALLTLSRRLIEYGDYATSSHTLTIGNYQLLAHLFLNNRAYHFLDSTSLSIILSRLRSAYIFFNLLFSSSSSLRCFN